MDGSDVSVGRIEKREEGGAGLSNTLQKEIWILLILVVVY